MDIVDEYNMLSAITSNDKKLYQPYYSTTNIKIQHNKNEILLHYNKKERLYVDKKSNIDRKNKSHK